MQEDKHFVDNVISNVNLMQLKFVCCHRENQCTHVRFIINEKIISISAIILEDTFDGIFCVQYGN